MRYFCCCASRRRLSSASSGAWPAERQSWRCVSLGSAHSQLRDSIGKLEITRSTLSDKACPFSPLSGASMPNRHQFTRAE
eukprot:8270468-Alexandrium_andersonii.AAC.1